MDTSKPKVKPGGEGKTKTPKTRKSRPPRKQRGGQERQAPTSPPGLRSEPKDIVPRCATDGTDSIADLPDLPRDLRPKKIDLTKAIQLRAKGLTYQEIADYFGASKQATHEALRPYITEQGNLQAYKVNRADILASKGMELLRSMTDDDIKKMAPRDRLMGFGILYDKERLERGQSTGNVGLAVFLGVISAACRGAKIADVEAEDL